MSLFGSGEKRAPTRPVYWLKSVSSVREKSFGIEVEGEIAPVQILAAELDLDVELGRDRALVEDVLDALAQVVVAAPAVGVVVERAGADRVLVVDRRGDAPRRHRCRCCRTTPVPLSWNWLRSNSGVNSLKPAGRAGAGDDVEVGHAQARLDRVDVDVLQELRLQQLADPRRSLTPAAR